MLERVYDIKGLLDRIGNRSTLDDPDVLESVMQVMRDVRSDGDEALRMYTKKFDGCALDEFKVSDEEMQAAYESIDAGILEVIREAMENIRAYHEKQREESWVWDKKPGIRLGQRISAVNRVGVYVPGGTAPLFSSVLMNVVPAVVAGVGDIIMCTPPGEDGSIDCLRLAAAYEAGVSAIYKLGGAQAIFAMAFGTESIPKVDKIVGPGNIYVANAKKLAFGYCGIDMIAGPSEILVIADAAANPRFAALDLLSQAEHDERAAAVLIALDESIAEKIAGELARQMESLPRKEIIRKSLEDYGTVYIASDKDEAVAVANTMAPEHCELLVENPVEYSDGIINAGAIFSGDSAPEPLGDYWAGPNHTLPTGGSARFFSPLGVYDFYKRTSIIDYDRDNLIKDGKKIMDFASAEGLDAHAASISARLGGSENE